MKDVHLDHWGWGFHIDLNGNLRDVFPVPKARSEQTAPKAVRPKWHVKKRLKKPLMAAH